MTNPNPTAVLRAFCRCAALLAVGVLLLAGLEPSVAHADSTLTLPSDTDTGVFLHADGDTLFSILDELAARTGMAIKGRRHLVDRTVSGEYRGDLPAVLKALLTNESYTVVLGAAGDQGYTPVETLIFTGQTPWTPPQHVDKAAPARAEDHAAAKADRPAPAPRPVPPAPPTVVVEQVAAPPPPPPPEPPQVDQRVLSVISRPPPDTPEGKRFDAAVEKVRSKLEKSLAPLKALR